LYSTANHKTWSQTVPENEQPKNEAAASPPDQISDPDITKFQLLTAYVGMAKQAKKTLEKEREAIEAKLELADFKIDESINQIREYHKFLAERYQIAPHDQINFASGNIKRGTPPHEPTKE
jgi:hypothetical protein